MEIASSWKLYSENKSKLNISELSSNRSIFSPDSRTLCQSQNNSISFITKDKITSCKPPVYQSEQISCISTAFSKPWILSIGTSEGRIFFYDSSTNKFLSISPDSQPVKFIKMCSFEKSYFTEPYPVLFIQYPHGIFVTIDQNNLLKNIKNGTSDSIAFTKWQLSNDRFIHDSILINSNIPFPIYSNLHRFPAVYSVGNPFISVSSLPREKTESTNFLKKAAQFLKWLSQEANPDDKEEIPAMKTNSEWTLTDDKREGMSIAADPTGRWAAICDNMYRVIIIDTVFGNITKVLKGYRDAQVAWFSPSNEKSKNPFLIIYVPTREIIVACTIPNGSIVAAVKVVRDGKLFQTIDDKSKYGTAFVYPTGDVAIINVTATINNDDEDDDDDDTNNNSNENLNLNEKETENTSNNDSFDSRHFTFPAIITAEKDHSIHELQKLLIQKKLDHEEVKKLASKISDKIVGGYFIKILTNSATSRSSAENDENDDDFLKEVVNIISSNLKVNGFEGSSQEFFNSCFFSVPSDGESDLIIYKVLSDKWTEYSKFEKINVQEDQYPQTSLTENYKDQISSVIDSIYLSPADGKKEDAIPSGAVRRPSLRNFLTNPLKFPLFFFSFMRSADIKVDSIFDSFRFSRENRDEFILQFLTWIIKCQPAQVLLTQEAIADFLNVKMIKSTAVKEYRKLEIDPSTFQAIALSNFLSF